jgi:CBS domain-containing protein
MHRYYGKHNAPMPQEPNIQSSPESVPLKALAAEKAGALQADDTVQTAGERMRKHDAEVWPVAEDRKLVGMIHEKNPDWKLGGHGHDPKDCTVGEIMKRDVTFCYEDEDCDAARRKMDEHGLQFLPVVDRQMRIVGIFSREEIEEKVDAPGGERTVTAHGTVRPALEA